MTKRSVRKIERGNEQESGEKDRDVMRKRAVRKIEI